MSWRITHSLTVVVLTVAAACARPTDPPPPPVEDLLSGKSLYSSNREELIIRDFFQDRRDGFFVDVGCGWAIKCSNTAYLELKLDWSGIAIDALPEYGPAWKEKRPRSKFFPLFVGDHDDDVETFYRSDLTDASSYRKDFVDWRIRRNGTPVGFEELEVPTTTLTTLLRRNGVERIDFLSMDIEGAEPLALAGFDIDSFRPALACVEAKPVTRADIRAYFEAHRYHRLERYAEYDEMNEYYAPLATRK